MTDPPPRIAAFFDFDRTLIDTDGGVQFGKELIRYFRRKTLADRPGTLGWLGRVAAYHLRIAVTLLKSLLFRLFYKVGLIRRSTLVSAAYRAMRGVPHDEIRFLARDFVDEILVHRMYPDAKRLMADHHKKGHLVIVATTNMRFVVEPFKRHAPIDDIIGIELLTKGGICTGEFRGPTYGAEKAQAIRDYAHARNISLPKSYAYTDHYSDHFILPLAGNPTVVNPKWRMRRIAKKHRWNVVRFGAPSPVPSPRR